MVSSSSCSCVWIIPSGCTKNKFCPSTVTNKGHFLSRPKNSRLEAENHSQVNRKEKEYHPAHLHFESSRLHLLHNFAPRIDRNSWQVVCKKNIHFIKQMIYHTLLKPNLQPWTRSMTPRSILDACWNHHPWRWWPKRSNRKHTPATSRFTPVNNLMMTDERLGWLVVHCGTVENVWTFIDLY